MHHLKCVLQVQCTCCVHKSQCSRFRCCRSGYWRSLVAKANQFSLDMRQFLWQMANLMENARQKRRPQVPIERLTFKLKISQSPPVMAITRNTAFRISSCFDTKRSLLLVKPIIEFVNSLNCVQEATMYDGESRMQVRRIYWIATRTKLFTRLTAKNPSSASVFESTSLLVYVYI